jgi:glycosyltransferase involved in cell wall biosynthesis
MRLVYTSTPWRGLKVLADVWERLNRDDVELVVYSGTKIYGQEFYDREEPKFAPIYKRLEDLGITRFDYAPNETVREALKSAHILAYPNTWEETSCLAAIEALAAGCKVVTTSFGALPETCGVWADYIPASAKMVDRYTDLLNRAIDTFWEDETQLKLLDQVDHYNRYWTWDYRLKQWDKFFKEIRNGRKVDSESHIQTRVAA